MATSEAAIRFFENWQQQQKGALERGGRLTLVYDKARLPRCFANVHGAEFGDTVATIRFHPRATRSVGASWRRCVRERTLPGRSWVTSRVR